VRVDGREQAQSSFVAAASIPPANMMFRKRRIYFHEDDYCQQQLLPREAAEYARAELHKIGQFSDKHRDPGGSGWNDIYVRQEATTELPALKITKEEFGPIVSAFLPPFDVVFTGYSSYRTRCKKTAAWGTSSQCALFADWDDAGIISNSWTGFFDESEEAILAATRVIAALGERHPLIYVDWAWRYTCDADDETTFASMLRTKLHAIADSLRTPENS
jgi:hypothetical protein